MARAVRCGQCQALLQVADRPDLKRVICPKCKSPIDLTPPAAAAVVPPPPPAPTVPPPSTEDSAASYREKMRQKSQDLARKFKLQTAAETPRESGRTSAPLVSVADKAAKDRIKEAMAAAQKEEREALERKKEKVLYWKLGGGILLVIVLALCFVRTGETPAKEIPADVLAQWKDLETAGQAALTQMQEAEKATRINGAEEREAELKRTWQGGLDEGTRIAEELMEAIRGFQKKHKDAAEYKDHLYGLHLNRANDLTSFLNSKRTTGFPKIKVIAKSLQTTGGGASGPQDQERLAAKSSANKSLPQTIQTQWQDRQKEFQKQVDEFLAYHKNVCEKVASEKMPEVYRADWSIRGEQMHGFLNKFRSDLGGEMEQWTNGAEALKSTQSWLLQTQETLLPILESGFDKILLDAGKKKSVDEKELQKKRP